PLYVLCGASKNPKTVPNRTISVHLEESLPLLSLSEGLSGKKIRALAALLSSRPVLFLLILSKSLRPLDARRSEAGCPVSVVNRFLFFGCGPRLLCVLCGESLCEFHMAGFQFLALSCAVLSSSRVNSD